MFSLSKAFLLKLGEQVAVAFLAGAAATIAAGSGSLSRDLLVGAVTAGLRAAYGVLVKDLGSGDSPSVK